MPLTVAFFNAKEVGLKKAEISSYLVDYAVDVLLIQERYFRPIHGPNIGNFNIARNDRVARGDGTHVYTKRNLHCVPLTPPPLSNLEASVCRMDMVGTPPLIFASCYLRHWRQLLRCDVEALFAMGDSVILAGNFNSGHAQWNCSTTNANGLAMKRYSDELQFQIITPPFQPGQSTQNPMEVALLRNVALPLLSVETQAFDADNWSVILEFGYPVVSALTHPDDIEAINYAKSLKPRMRLPSDVRELRRAKNAAERAFCVFPSKENRVCKNALRRKLRDRLEELRSLTVRFENIKVDDETP
jgi:hypothetical protein